MAIPSGSFRQGLTQVSSVQYDELGAIRFEGGKFYKYVKIDNTTAGVAVASGDCLMWAAATGASTNTVVSDSTDADTAAVGAGIATATVAAADTLTGMYLWAQVTGTFTANQTLAGTPADGNILKAGTDGALTVAVETEVSVHCAVSNDASAKLCTANFPF